MKRKDDVKALKFRTDLLDAVRSGKKTATTRLSHKLNEGDLFYAVDENGIGNTIYEVTLKTVGRLANLCEYYHYDEGYMTAVEMYLDLVAIYGERVEPSTKAVTYSFRRFRRLD